MPLLVHTHQVSESNYTPGIVRESQGRRHPRFRAVRITTLIKSLGQLHQIGLGHRSIWVWRVNENVALEVEAQAVEILKEGSNRGTDRLTRPRNVEVGREQDLFTRQVRDQHAGAMFELFDVMQLER